MNHRAQLWTQALIWFSNGPIVRKKRRFGFEMGDRHILPTFDGESFAKVLLRCREGFARLLQPTRLKPGLVCDIVNSPWENWDKGKGRRSWGRSVPSVFSERDTS